MFSDGVFYLHVWMAPSSASLKGTCGERDLLSGADLEGKGSNLLLSIISVVEFWARGIVVSAGAEARLDSSDE